MSLPPGSRLGHLEVGALIGEGGMGAVYRARDTKLNRDVALKVLLPAVATDPERLARFRREAQVLASLNHPHIGGIHGLEERDGTVALVLELVEGPTLADRIALGPIPVDEALPIARQIAEALEAAHDKGIIHRDLKPANIKLREDGTVKVLDFGLAKALDVTGASATADPNLSPTLTAAATQMGVILGTAAYMAPEQARGKPVDKRADVWGFGAVLFEMLTGQRAFAGEDVSVTLANVINQPPDWTRLPGGLRPSLETCLRRCLEKAPRQRLADMQDVRLALEGAFDVAPVPTAVEGRRVTVAGLAVSVAVGVGLALVAGVAMGRLVWPAPAARPVGPRAQFQLNPPPMPAVWRQSSFDVPFAMAPDGRSVAYTSAGKNALWVRSIADGGIREVQGGAGAGWPFWSPDSEWIAVWRDGQLLKLPAEGGTAIPLADAVRNRTWGSADWEADTIAFTEFDGARHVSSLRRVSSDGGVPEMILEVEGVLTDVDLLPGGAGAVFTHGDVDRFSVAAVTFDAPEVRVLVERGHSPRFLPPDRLIYAADGWLWAVGFDPDSLTIEGRPQRVRDNVAIDDYWGHAYFDIAADGTLVYVPADAEARRQLVWVDRAGRTATFTDEVSGFQDPRLSGDGQRLVVVKGASETQSGGRELWVYEVDGRPPRRLVSAAGPSGLHHPQFSADDRLVYFCEAVSTPGRAGPPNIYWITADGSASGAEPLLGEPYLPRHAMDVSPDGAQLLVLGLTQFRETGWDILAWDLVGDAGLRPIVQSPGFDSDASLSPDGHWLAYTSTRDGTNQVYVQAYPNGPARRVSPSGGYDPVWSPTGEELFYRNGTTLMTVRVKGGTDLALGAPEPLFDLPGWYTHAVGHTYDVAPDGRFVLVVADADEASRQGQMTVVLDWGSELSEDGVAP